MRRRGHFFQTVSVAASKSSFARRDWLNARTWCASCDNTTNFHLPMLQWKSKTGAGHQTPHLTAHPHACLCTPVRKLLRMKSQVRMLKATIGIVVVLSVELGKMLASQIYKFLIS